MNKSVFDYIVENLSGEMKQTALDFVNYLQDSCVEFIKDNGIIRDTINHTAKNPTNS
ncbi:MAG: hypothetical protein IKK46_02565 [Clostridia bacterium]|nr:hypothetical protein [Clostridia bacterium]